MGSVGLHHSIDAEDAFEDKGQERNLIFFCEQGVGVGELLDVVGAVVGWEGDACEDDPGSAGLESGDDFVEVGAGVFDAQAAQAVVATELHDDDCGLESEDAVEAFDTVFGGIAADALVDDTVLVAEGVEVGLEVVGVALAGVGAVAGGETVAETDQEGSCVVCSIRGSGLCGYGGC